MLIVSISDSSVFFIGFFSSSSHCRSINNQRSVWIKCHGRNYSCRQSVIVKIYFSLICSIYVCKCCQTSPWTDNAQSASRPLLRDPFERPFHFLMTKYSLGWITKWSVRISFFLGLRAFLVKGKTHFNINRSPWHIWTNNAYKVLVLNNQNLH